MGSSSRVGRPGFSFVGAGIAVLFLVPLLWGGWSSLKGQPGSSQESGFGFGNYVAMAKYGEGVGTYLTNTLMVALMTVGFILMLTVGSVMATLGGLLGVAIFAKKTPPGAIDAPSSST